MDQIAGYPNVRVKLVRYRSAPGVPDLVAPLWIWLSDQRFRIRDGSGRPFHELIRDVTEPRGFGRLPRSIEDFMDAGDEARSPRPAPSEFYGDRTSGTGVLIEPGQVRQSLSAAVAAPVAEQFLATTADPAAESVVGTRLGRPVREHRRVVEGQDGDHRFRTEVTEMVGFPYILERRIRDAAGAEDSALRVRVEITELAENVVGADDLTVPPE